MKKVTLENSKVQDKILKDFMTRVNKLTVGRATSDKFYGRVECVQAADYDRGYNEYLDRMGYGTRKFAVSGSKVISNGKYTIAGLRAKLESAIA